MKLIVRCDCCGSDVEVDQGVMKVITTAYILARKSQDILDPGFYSVFGQRYTSLEKAELTKKFMEMKEDDKPEGEKKFDYIIVFMDI